MYFLRHGHIIFTLDKLFGYLSLQNLGGHLIMSIYRYPCDHQTLFIFIYAWFHVTSSFNVWQDSMFQLLATSWIIHICCKLRVHDIIAICMELSICALQTNTKLKINELLKHNLIDQERKQEKYKKAVNYMMKEIDLLNCNLHDCS